MASWNTLLGDASELALVGTAIAGLLLFATKILWRLLRRVTRLLDEVEGTPAEHGIPARPGVLARLAESETAREQILGELTSLRTGQEAMSQAVEAVASDTRQLQHNGGAHVADYTRDTRDAVRHLATQMEQVIRRLDSQERTVEAAARDALIACEQARGVHTELGEIRAVLTASAPQTE